ncbi:MAG: type II toxin-antitoxin system VapC family toxin [Synergistaceae bacterium]|nr:type II toxin-antitoxin system VapC family toxin [Synergistaceae bacterium]
MNILLDTHIALWAITEPTKLSKKALELLQNGNNNFYVSVASVWEVAIKNIRHPEDIPMSDFEYANFCVVSGFNILPLRVEHIFTLKTLHREDDAPKHNDPFDKIMLSQAKSEGFSFLTDDKLLPFYNEIFIIEA